MIRLKDILKEISITEPNPEETLGLIPDTKYLLLTIETKTGKILSRKSVFYRGSTTLYQRDVASFQPAYTTSPRSDQRTMYVDFAHFNEKTRNKSFFRVKRVMNEIVLGDEGPEWEPVKGPHDAIRIRGYEDNIFYFYDEDSELDYHYGSPREGTLYYVNKSGTKKAVFSASSRTGNPDHPEWVIDDLEDVIDLTLHEILIDPPPGTLKVGRFYKVGYNLRPLEYRGRVDNDTHMFMRHDNKPEFRTDSQIKLGFEVGSIRLMKPGERLSEIIVGYGYNDLMKSFPGHAKQKNPVGSPEYQWYLRAVNFVQSTNNIQQAAEVVKFFQNNFLGLDYDERDSDEGIVKWWLSKEEQDWIRDELNVGNDYSHTYNNSKSFRKHMREIIVSNVIQSVYDLVPGERYDIMVYTKKGVEAELQKGVSIDSIWRRDAYHLEFVRIDEKPAHTYQSGHMGPERITEPVFVFKGIRTGYPRPRDEEEVIFSKTQLEEKVRDRLIRVSTR